MTSRVGSPSSATTSPGVTSSPPLPLPPWAIGGLVSVLVDRHAAGTLRLLPERQLDAEDPILIAGTRLLGVDVDSQLDDAAKWPGGDLDLLIDPALGLLDRPAARDGQLATGDLDVDLGEIDSGQVDLDDRPLRL